MITMMMSINPSDMAHSPRDGRQMTSATPPLREKHNAAFGSSDGTRRFVIPGRCAASNPEPRDSGSGPSDHPGMTGEVELLRLQLQRGRIDAVAQAGRAGTVLEDVAEMA